MTDNVTSDREFGEVENTQTNNDEEVQDSETEEETEESSEETDETNKTGEDTEDGETEQESESKLTEKGTKLDPNPQSAVHQQLANERRLRNQYQEVLNNPDLLAKYAQTKFGNVPVKQDTDTKSETKEYTAKDFGSIDDVAKVVNDLQKGFADKTKTYEEKINQLNTVVATVVNSSRQQQIANKLETEIQTVSKFPEFNPKNKDYVEGLEQRISEKFRELDFDERTGTFRGRVSFEKLAQDHIENARLGKKAGSLKAQTVIQRKSEGKVKTSSKVDDGSADDDNLSPGQSIAKGIKKLGLR